MALGYRRDETVIRLQVSEVYPNTRIAYAEDDEGHRFLLNDDSRGVRLETLTGGDLLDALVSSRNHVMSAEKV